MRVEIYRNNKLDRVFDAPENPDVFPVLSRKQLLFALLRMGNTEQDVVDKINTLQEPDKSVAMIEFKNTSEYHRDHEWVAALGALMGYTDDQINGEWRT